jgi:serine/threonine protein kinase
MTTPTTIGRYQVKQELGRGGMATVLLAYDPQFKRDVAIKVLPRELLHDREFRARFEREATTIAALEHSAIVPVYDFGEEAGQPYLVMRFMGGGSLTDRIRQGPIPLAETSRVLSHLAPALDYAHNKGVIHRDLKPDNILFDQLGEPYLSDFGIAKLAESTATLTGNAIVGTPAYMSPEQGRGDSDLDGRSDLYSLGTIIFEMLTGRVPYEASTPMGQVYKHLSEPIPDVLQVAMQRGVELPPAIQAVLGQALAKRKYVRYASARELSAALEAVARGEAPPASISNGATLIGEPPGRGPGGPPGASGPIASRPSRPRHTPVRRRSRLPLYLSMVAGAAMLVGGGSFLASRGMLPFTIPGLAPPASPTFQAALLPSETPAPPPPPQPSATPPLPEPSATAALPTADTPTPEPSPTITSTSEPSGPVIGGADKLAFVNNNDIWISDLDGANLTRLTTSGGSKQNLQWTPDGKSLTYISGRAALQVDVVTRQEKTILSVNWADYLGGFEISPDGSLVALSLSDGIFLLPFDLPSLSLIRTQDQLRAATKCNQFTDSPTRQVRWSQDSTQIAFVTTITDQGRQVELIKVYDISPCGQPPVRIDEFPAQRFTMNNYQAKPVIVDFDWDGDKLFALAVNQLNDFGEIYIYNMADNVAKIIVPFEGRCCYRSFAWSPDKTYFLFAYQDRRFGAAAQVYYVIYGTIGSGTQYTPLPFPAEVLAGSRENLQPALRPAASP